MSVGNITQSVSIIPAPPHRGVDIQTVFVIKQEDFQDHLAGTTVTELNTLKDQLNLRIGEINSTTTTMNGYAGTASVGASTATTKAGEASTSAGEALAYRNQAETFKNNASTSATKASQWADNNYNVAVETGKYSAKHWSTVAQNTVNNKIDKVTSTDNAVVRFDGATGQVQNSGVTVDDSGNVGIGTNSPSSKLTVLNDSINIESSNTSSERSFLWLGKYNGSSSILYGTHISCYHNYGVSINSSLIISPSNIDVLSVDSGGNTLHISPLGALGYGTGAGGTVTQLTSKSTAVTLNKPSGRIITHNATLAGGASIQFTLNNSLISITDTVYVCMAETGASLSNYDIRTMSSYGYCYIYITNKSVTTLSEAMGLNFEVFKGSNV